MALATHPCDAHHTMSCCFGRKTHRQAEVAPVKDQPARMPTNVSANGYHSPNAEKEKQALQLKTQTTQETNIESTPETGEDKARARNNEEALPDGTSFQMPSVSIGHVPDGEGSPITLGKLFGVWTAPWPKLPEQIMRSQGFTFHDSDVILLGYAKSGTHWLWEMIHMLLKGRAEHTSTPKERLMISFSTQEFFDTLTPPRVFNCHAPFVGLPPAVTSGRNKCKMVYLLRNPKDLCVSYYHHIKSAKDFNYEGTFHGFVDLFLQGKVPGDSWFDYVLGWEQTLKNNPQLPVLVLHYEDVKENPALIVSRIAEFLGLSRPQSLFEEIARECSIQRMKQVDEELKEQFPVNNSKTGKNFIYRKGEVGDWKRWFSVLDNEKFDKFLAKKMAGSDLTFRYELPELEKVESTYL